jgi:hypothetical protein
MYEHLPDIGHHGLDEDPDPRPPDRPASQAKPDPDAKSAALIAAGMKT